MSNKSRREQLEMLNVFGDPKYTRQAWKAVGSAILRNPATRPIRQYDKDGNETFASQIEDYSYNQLKNDLKRLGEQDREPTELEMILTCQIVKARYDTAAATFVRDTLGAKPVDESKVEANLSNQYEQLTDEELELLAAHREKLAQAKEQAALADGKEKADDVLRENNVDGH